MSLQSSSTSRVLAAYWNNFYHFSGKNSSNSHQVNMDDHCLQTIPNFNNVWLTFQDDFILNKHIIPCFFASGNLAFVLSARKYFNLYISHLPLPYFRTVNVYLFVNCFIFHFYREIVAESKKKGQLNGQVTVNLTADGVNTGYQITEQDIHRCYNLLKPVPYQAA